MSMSLKDLRLLTMKNSKKILLSATLPLWMIAVSGCGSLQAVSPPRLQERTLELASDYPGAYYQFVVCVEPGFIRCRKEQIVREVFDLSDPEIRKQLMDADFVLVKRDLP